MTEDSNPLLAFFRAVLDEMKKRLTPAEFADLLKECNTEREKQDIGTNATPGQTSSPGN